MDLAPYRKFVIAVVAAAVTGAHAFGIPVAEDVSVKVIALFDAVAALLVYAVANDPE